MEVSGFVNTVAIPISNDSSIFTSSGNTLCNDLKALSECQEAVGIVKNTKKLMM